MLHALALALSCAAQEHESADADAPWYPIPTFVVPSIEVDPERRLIADGMPGDEEFKED